MKNLDTIREELKNASKAIFEAYKTNNEEAVTAAFSAYNETIKSLYGDEQLEAIKEQVDNSIITARGLRRITSEEKTYAEALISASNAASPKQALVDVPKAMPTTIIDTIVENIKAEHPLLAAIDFTPSEFNTKMLYNEAGVTKATWGPMTAKIATELSLTVKTMEATACKLTAFLPVPKGFLDYSATYLVNLIISMLTESYGAGLEYGIINGTGKDEPIGMIKDLNGSVVSGVYPDKATKTLTEITPEKYCALVAEVSKNSAGAARNVTEVVFVCNPIDYLEKVCPATTVLTANGTYVNDVFPFPTKVITSEQVVKGKAVLGIAKRFLATIGANKNGAIDYDDSCQFIEDNRVYTIKGYGNGRPKDNTSFVYVDISGLQPKEWRMQLIDSASAAEVSE